jgi:hypothetical protein
MKKDTGGDGTGGVSSIVHLFEGHGGFVEKGREKEKKKKKFGKKPKVLQLRMSKCGELDTLGTRLPSPSSSPTDMRIGESTRRSV